MQQPLFLAYDCNLNHQTYEVNILSITNSIYPGKKFFIKYDVVDYAAEKLSELDYKASQYYGISEIIRYAKLILNTEVKGKPDLKPAFIKLLVESILQDKWNGAEFSEGINDDDFILKPAIDIFIEIYKRN